MVQQGDALPVTLDFSSAQTEITGTWSAPTLRALGIPLSRIGVDGASVRFELVGDQAPTVFTGTLAADRLAGSFAGSEGEGTFTFDRRPAPAAASRAEEVTFANGDVRLAGTLLLPVTSGRHPAVVFLHGAGPEGRFGSRFLAEHLAERGVAALIFDKRGVGGSSGDWQRSTLEDLADDALAGVAFLRGRPEVDASAVGIYGHSQGGAVAPLAATRGPGVAFLVSCASYGGPNYEQDLYRVEAALDRSDFPDADKRRAKELYRRFIDVARSGEGIPELTAEVSRLQSEAWVQWLGIPPAGHWLWAFYRPVGNFDTLPAWRRVRQPTLLIYGERDRIVPPEVSIRRIGDALAAAGNASWGAILLPRTAHDFTIAPEPGEPFAWRQVAPGLGDVVTGWVRLQADRAR